MPPPQAGISKTLYQSAISHCYYKKKARRFACKIATLGHNPPLDLMGLGESMTSPVALRARDLAVWRGERCLFEALDFDLGERQLALVIGSNGAGKTTLLRVLAGLSAASAGSVTWRGAALGSLPLEHRGEIAYRGHLDGLKKDLTVLENLRFCAAVWGARAPLEPLLLELKLADVAHARVRHLSAGQQRRAALATLKLTNAKLWILDEPTTNLDADGRARIRDWIRQHLAAGGAAVVATHQPDELSGPGTLVMEL
jgi:heme exporter protein A